MPLLLPWPPSQAAPRALSAQALLCPPAYRHPSARVQSMAAVDIQGALHASSDTAQLQLLKYVSAGASGSGTLPPVLAYG